MSAWKPKRKAARLKMPALESDQLKMSRSGASASGYHAPTEQDVNDIVKRHRTSSGPGLINADEGVRRDRDNKALPIDSLSGKVRDEAERFSA